jgi:predicted exporter
VVGASNESSAKNNSIISLTQNQQAMNWRSALTKNWKTTTVGSITAVTGYIAMFPAGFKDEVVNVSRYIQVGGLASLGLVSKDFDQTGNSLRDRE